MVMNDVCREHADILGELVMYIHALLDMSYRPRWTILLDDMSIVIRSLIA